MLSFLLSVVIITSSPSLSEAAKDATQVFTPKCGPVHIYYTNKLPPLHGDAYSRRCRIRIGKGTLRKIGFRGTCALVTHEMGHLAGRNHSSNPRSIMAPVIKVIPSDC